METSTPNGRDCFCKDPLFGKNNLIIMEDVETNISVENM